MNNEQHFNCTESPKVTVLMSVYNGEMYLRESIESILNQTFQDFEFLIIDDGSTDNSRAILLSYKDPRIRLISNEQNIGLTKSLNKGLSLSKGEYIARMDADDISVLQRLAIQVNYMDTHPEVGICGSWIKFFGDQSDILEYPLSSGKIKIALLFFDSLAHPSVMIRKSFLDKFKLRYDENFKHAQDYELWSRCINKFPIVNLPQILVYFRLHNEQISTISGNQQDDYAKKVRVNLLNLLDINPDNNEKMIHEAIGNKDYSLINNNFDIFRDWLYKLKSKNDEINYYPKKSFSKTLAIRWFRTISHKNKFQFGGLLNLTKWSLYWLKFLIVGLIFEQYRQVNYD